MTPTKESARYTQSGHCALKDNHTYLEIGMMMMMVVVDQMYCLLNQRTMCSTMEGADET